MERDEELSDGEALPSNFLFGNLDEGGGLDADWLDEVLARPAYSLGTSMDPTTSCHY